MSLSKVTLINLGLTKFLRFMKIWGLRKTLFKVLGRRRSVLPSFVRIPAAKKRDIGIIGCGQFSFSTIGSVVTRKFSNRIVDAFDIDEKAKNEFSKFFSIKNPATPAAAAARASTGMNSRFPPDAEPRPPGCCTECVASNTTGAPVLRMTARLRMSDTRLL